MIFEPVKHLEDMVNNFDISDQYKNALINNGIFMAFNTALSYSGEFMSKETYFRNIRLMKWDIEQTRQSMTGHDVWRFNFLLFERYIINLAKERMLSYMKIEDVKEITSRKYKIENEGE